MLKMANVCCLVLLIDWCLLFMMKLKGLGLNVITELVIGYIYPGKPLANVAFKTYGFISMRQALNFVQDFKLGHYMKIAPKLMFLVQVNKNLRPNHNR